MAGLGVLLDDLAGLIVAVGLAAGHLDLEHALDALHLLGLLHGLAQNIGDLIGLGGGVIVDAAEHELEQQEHHQQRCGKATHHDGDELFIPLFLLRRGALLAGGLNGGGGDGLRRLVILRLLQIGTDIAKVHGVILAELLQILQHGIRRGVALLQIGAHGLHADQLQRLRDIGIDLTGGQWDGAQVLDGHGHGGLPLEGQTSGKHLIEHHAGGVDIAAGVGAVTSGLLRGDVVDGAQRLLRQGLAGAGQTGDAEVRHLDAAVPQDHDVLRLDVPVDDAPAVGMAQRPHDLGDEVQRLPPVHLATALHVLLQGDAVHQLHNDILRVAAAGHVVHRHDVGVGQLGHRQRLVPEAAAEVGVLRQIVFQDLHRHHSVQAVALGLVDVGHAAAADELQYLIAVIQHFSDILIHRCHLLQIFISSTAVTLSGAPR